MMPQLNLNNSCILLKLNSMTVFFTKVNLLVLLFSFTMILITKMNHLRASEYLMRLANWAIPHLLLSCFQISYAEFLPRCWMVNLLKIALWLNSMKKEQKDLCVPLRTRLIFQANKNLLGRSTKRDSSMESIKIGVVMMAVSLLVQQTSEVGKMGHFINYKRKAPMITTK